MSNSRHPGIKLRHKKGCAKTPCTCTPSYRPTVYDKHSGRKIEGPTFGTLAEAKTWRILKAADVMRGKVDLPSSRTLRSVASEFLAGAESGAIMNSHGLPYKPKVLRDYRADLERRVLPDLGARRITDIRRHDIQRLVDRMVKEGLSGSRVRNILNSLRSVYRFALSRVTGVEETPLRNLELPANREKRRERIADPVEARALLAALPEADRPIWATAIFAGLRAGELRALRWQDVDVAAGTIRVERGWDDRAGAIEPKSDAAKRTVPIVGALRPHLVARQLACGWSTHGPGLVFGRLPGVPFNDRAVTKRARRAWNEAGMRSLGLHEARHSAASLFIAAEVTPKQISTWLGHSSITLTFDRYGHLFPNANEEGVAKVDAYFAQTG